MTERMACISSGLARADKSDRSGSAMTCTHKGRRRKATARAALKAARSSAAVAAHEPVRQRLFRSVTGIVTARRRLC